MNDTAEPTPEQANDVGSVFCCARRDELLQRLADGDQNAVRLVGLALPRDLAPAVLRAERDNRLRAAAARLRQAVPGIKDHRIATLIRIAVDRMSAGRPLQSSAFGDLQQDEREAVEADLRAALNWAPVRRGVAAMPGIRALLDIIA